MMNDLIVLISPHFVERLYQRTRLGIQFVIELFRKSLKLLAVEGEDYYLYPLYGRGYILFEKKGRFLHAISLLPINSKYVKGRRGIYKIADFSKIVSVSIIGYRYTNGREDL